MLRLTVKVGEAVEIAGVGVIQVSEKSGQRVKLSFDMEQGPIRIVSAPATQAKEPGERT